MRDPARIEGMLGKLGEVTDEADELRRRIARQSETIAALQAGIAEAVTIARRYGGGINDSSRLVELQSMAYGATTPPRATEDAND